MPDDHQLFKFKHICFFTILLFSLNAFSQKDSSLVFSKYKSSVSITALGTGVLGSAGYRTIIKEYKKSLLEGGITFSYFRGPTLGYEIFDFFGKRNNHLVLGMGYYFSKQIKHTYRYHSSVENSFSTYPNFEIGYCYWNPNSRLSYMFLIHPLMNYSGGNFNPGWIGFTASYHFATNFRLLNTERQQDASGNNTHFVIGNESGIGLGKLLLTGVGETKSISLNTNFYIKYYFSILYLKAFAGISYLNQHQITSDFTYSIYGGNPSFLNAGIGAGIVAFSNTDWRFETGIDFGNYFSKNKMQIKPMDLPYQLRNNIDFHLTNPDYLFSNSFRPFLISPELSLYRKFNSRIEAGLSFRYSINHYQLGSYYYTLKSNQIYLGFNIQYLLHLSK
jgi:hypothetical protein